MIGRLAVVDDALTLEYATERDLQRHVVDPILVNYVGSVRMAYQALPDLERSAGRLAVVSSGASFAGPSERALAGLVQ